MRTIKGFGFIELLIAAFIFAFGILSIEGLQISAFNSLQDNYYEAAATNQITNIIEQYAAGDYDCSLWQTENQKLLPHARSKCNRHSITICWLGRNDIEHCLDQKTL